MTNDAEDKERSADLRDAMEKAGISEGSGSIQVSPQRLVALQAVLNHAGSALFMSDYQSVGRPVSEDRLILAHLAYTALGRIVEAAPKTILQKNAAELILKNQALSQYYPDEVVAIIEKAAIAIAEQSQFEAALSNAVSNLTETLYVRPAADDNTGQRPTSN